MLKNRIEELIKQLNEIMDKYDFGFSGHIKEQEE